MALPNKVTAAINSIQAIEDALAEKGNKMNKYVTKDWAGLIRKLTTDSGNPPSSGGFSDVVVFEEIKSIILDAYNYPITFLYQNIDFIVGDVPNGGFGDTSFDVFYNVPITNNTYTFICNEFIETPIEEEEE